jgi:lysophospholipase L1-like esterase
MSQDTDFFSQLFEITYKMRIEWFKMLNDDAKKGGIVLAGDSITHEFLIHEMMDAYGKIHNRGIGGDTSTGLLARINESILDLKPSQVFLLIGTNDLLEMKDDISPLIDNIEKIIDITLSASADTEFYLISLYPVNTSDSEKIDKLSVSTRTNEQIDAVNVSLKQLALEKGVHYLDFNRLLKDESGNFRLEYTRDGLHPSPTGHKVMLHELQKYFKI